MATQQDVTDLTRGVYRRLYAGFIRGQRICSVSLMAEAWFWRIHAAADDFGNLDGDPVLCHAATAGRRAEKVTVAEVAAMVDELVTAGLIRRYTAGGEYLLHVVGFTTFQPSGKNGKRLKRFPHSPWDNESGSGGIRVNPSEASASHSHSHSHSENDSKNQNPAARGGAPSPAAKAAPAQAPGSDDVVLVFPVRASQTDQSREWGLTRATLDEFVTAFPELNVQRVLQGCLFKLRNGGVTLKTARGMKTFLWGWLQRELKFLRPSAGGPPRSARDRTHDMIENVCSEQEAST